MCYLKLAVFDPCPLIPKLPTSLRESQGILEKAYAKKDTTALRAELHRLWGVIVLFKMPRVEHVFLSFQSAVKAEPQAPDQLEQTYQAFNQAIDAFCEAHEKGAL